ncbi:MAG: hypothetical protein CBB70_16055 [Planctomycetaceae bacterium TMED10]|nr:MAG: hypothetical protein CBB70_16055 [Planctomycetaceae bacterium TMED10]
MVSLPALFKQHGYTTQSNGKIYHHQNDDLQAWSHTPWRPENRSIWWAKPGNQPLEKNGRRMNGPRDDSNTCKLLPMEAADVRQAPAKK